MALEQLQTTLREILDELGDGGISDFYALYQQLEGEQSLDQQLIAQLRNFAAQYQKQAIPLATKPEVLVPHLEHLHETLDQAQAQLAAAISPQLAVQDARPESEQPLVGERAFETALRQARGTRFQADQRLQAGAIAVGYAGLDRETNSKIILKLPAEHDPQQRDVWTSPELLEKASASIQRESEILTQIYNPLIATKGSAHPIQPVASGVVDLSGLPPVHWTAQSFAAGQRLSVGMLPMSGSGERTAIMILRQVTTMVLQLFALKLKHGDLKPDALFWHSDQQQLYVIDWNGANQATTAEHQAQEFEIVRRLVLAVLGGLSEQRLNVQELFFSPQAPDLSRGARLLLLRLGKEATPRPFSTIKELDRALGELENLWATANSVITSTPANDTVARSAQLSCFSLVLPRNQEPDSIANVLRQHQRTLMRHSMLDLRDWAGRDWRGSYEELLLEPALLLPDLVPFGLFGMFFSFWANERPKAQDVHLKPLVQALLQEDNLSEVERCVTALRGELGGQLLSLANLLVQTLKANADLTLADELSATNPVQAQDALSRANRLKSSAYYRAISQRIEVEQQRLGERQNSYRTMQALQQQAAKNLADQQNLLLLMEALRDSGMVTAAQIEAQNKLVSSLVRVQTEIQEPSQLPQLWSDRAWLALHANDLASELAGSYWQQIKQAIETWLCTGPVTSETAKPLLQALRELNVFDAGPDGIRSEAQQMQAALATLVTEFDGLATKECQNVLFQLARNPALQVFTQALQNVATQRASILDRGQITGSGNLIELADELLRLSQPSTSRYSPALAPLEAVNRRLAGESLARLLTQADDKDSSDPNTITAVVAKLAALDAEQARTWEQQRQQRKQQRLQGQIDNLTQDLKRLTMQFASIGEVSQQLQQLNERFDGYEKRLARLDSRQAHQLPPALADRGFRQSMTVEPQVERTVREPLAPPVIPVRPIVQEPPAPQPWHKGKLWISGGIAILATVIIGVWLISMWLNSNPANDPAPVASEIPAPTTVSAATTSPEPSLPTGNPLALSITPTIPAELPGATTSLTISSELLPGQTYTLTTTESFTATALLLILEEKQVTVPLSETSGLTVAFTLPITFFTNLVLDAILPIENVQLQLGSSQPLTAMTSIGVYTTTVQAEGLTGRTLSETLTLPDGRSGFYLWAAAEGEAQIDLSTGHVALTAGDEVEILELKADRYRVRVLSSQFDSTEAVDKEGWVRRVLVDGPGT